MLLTTIPGTTFRLDQPAAESFARMKA